MSSQRAELPFSPPRWLVPWITRLQVFLYERSNGRFGSFAAGMPHLLLRTVGRRSGRTSTVCLPYWKDGSGGRIVVASYSGGPRNPAWYHNLADHRANPLVVVRDRDRVFRARADVLDGDERAAIWSRLTADRPFYARYQEMTERRIPLVRLREAEAVE
jgi:deazaflavin-dependent oxidoreductase (nitroreductase family)